MSICPGKSELDKKYRFISHLQLYPIKHDNLTLGFDPTTQEGVYINEVHITSPQHCLVVDIDQLVGGTTEDYERHIDNSINRVADVYANVQSLPRNSPPTQFGFLSCKIREQKNKAGEYLDGLDQEKREKLIKFAVPLGRKQRQAKRKKCGEIKEEIQQRIAAKMQKTNRPMRGIS
ncbi:hypothetical protein LSH36_1220g00071 [Paralvinella palmiformis]|uniref:Uncharacterized protein n=1 Tax=Paralvinella palmiformis TaxID=53620 RepID=A0AAD9MRZ9_9ANNE|nr:hypothetical protein LSH36_1220g00071 [Paralvinella palmiformis]